MAQEVLYAFKNIIAYFQISCISFLYFIMQSEMSKFHFGSTYFLIFFIINCIILYLFSAVLISESCV